MNARLDPVLRSLSWCAAYLLAMWIGRLTKAPETGLATIWPAAGIGVLWLRSAVLRDRGVVLDLAALGGSALALNMLTGVPGSTAMVLCLGNVACALAGGLALAGRTFGGRLGCTTMRNLDDLRRLALVCLVAGLPPAGIAVLNQFFAHGVNLTPDVPIGVFLEFLSRYAAGTLLTVPVWLRLTSGSGHRELWDDVRRREFALFTVLVAVVAVVFLVKLNIPLSVAILPLLIWPSQRFSFTTTAILQLATAGAVVWATLARTSTLAHYGPYERSLYGQCELLALAGVSITLCLYRDERAAAMRELADVANLLRVQTRVLSESERIYREVFANAPVGTALLSWRQGAPDRILHCNNVLAEMFGLEPHQLLNTRLLDAVHPADRASLADLADGTGGNLQVVFQRHDGGEVTCRTSLSLLPSPNGEPYFVAMLEDVTAQQKAKEALEFQALHDGLTGLANRVQFLAQLADATAADSGDDAQVGLLYLDLDGFKAVNDGAGHTVGDELLRQVGQRLSRLTRPGDTVARLGGDEFAVLCRATDDAGLAAVGTRILDAINAPFRIRGHAYRVGASIGGATQLQATSTDVLSLLESADDAMYEAKRGGKGQLRLATAG